MSFELSFHWKLLHFYEYGAPGGTSSVLAAESEVIYGFVTVLLLTLNFGPQVHLWQTGID